MARKRKKKIETEIQNSICEYLNELDIPHTRTNSGMGLLRYGGVMHGAKAGWPDVTGCINGRFLGIEVKKPGERPTEDQYATLRRIQDKGGLAIWADSLDDTIKLIQAHLRGDLVFIGDDGDVHIKKERKCESNATENACSVRSKKLPKRPRSGPQANR